MYHGNDEIHDKQEEIFTGIYMEREPGWDKKKVPDQCAEHGRNQYGQNIKEQCEEGEGNE